MLIGIHPIREALRAGRPLERVLVAKGAANPRLQEVIELCREAGIPIRFEERVALDRLGGGQAHQGIVAMAAAQKYRSLADVTKGAQLLVLLDGVEDPHNLGAIVRTADAAGASAVLIPERRSAGVTDTVAKASAGAVEHMPIVRIGNVTQTLEKLKKDGFWIYGLDERGRDQYDRVEYATPTVFVLGGEGGGVHQLVQKHCDVLVSIPMAGKVSSLNVSVAAGVVLFEWRRRQALH